MWEGGDLEILVVVGGRPFWVLLFLFLVSFLFFYLFSLEKVPIPQFNFKVRVIYTSTRIFEPSIFFKKNKSPTYLLLNHYNFDGCTKFSLAS